MPDPVKEQEYREEAARFAEELAFYRGVAADPNMPKWCRSFARLKVQAVVRLIANQRTA